MNVREYLGDIIGGSLMVSEARQIAGLLLTAPTDAEWERAIVSDNLLQKPSIHSCKRMAATLRRRIEPHGPLFWQALRQSDEPLARQLLLLTVMRDSPILVDFMRTVLGGAFRLYRDALNANDWPDFIETRARAITGLADYSDSSLQKMGNNVIKILADAGYLRSARRKELQRVFLFAETREWLMAWGCDDYLSIMEVRS